MKLWFDYHVCDLRQLMSVYCKTKLELPELFMVIFFLFSPQRMNYFSSLRDILLKRPRVEFFIRHFLIFSAVRVNMRRVSRTWPPPDCEVGVDTEGSDEASGASGCLLCSGRSASMSITCTPGMWDDTPKGSVGYNYT